MRLIKHTNKLKYISWENTLIRWMANLLIVVWFCCCRQNFSQGVLANRCQIAHVCWALHYTYNEIYHFSTFWTLYKNMIDNPICHIRNLNCVSKVMTGNQRFFVRTKNIFYLFRKYYDISYRCSNHVNDWQASFQASCGNFCQLFEDWNLKFSQSDIVSN